MKKPIWNCSVNVKKYRFVKIIENIRASCHFWKWADSFDNNCTFVCDVVEECEHPRSIKNIFPCVVSEDLGMEEKSHFFECEDIFLEWARENLEIFLGYQCLYFYESVDELKENEKENDGFSCDDVIEIGFPCVKFCRGNLIEIVKKEDFSETDFWLGVWREEVKSLEIQVNDINPTCMNGFVRDDYIVSSIVPKVELGEHYFCGKSKAVFC